MATFEIVLLHIREALSSTFNHAQKNGCRKNKIENRKTWRLHRWKEMTGGVREGGVWAVGSRLSTVFTPWSWWNTWTTRAWTGCHRSFTLCSLSILCIPFLYFHSLDSPYFFWYFILPFVYMCYIPSFVWPLHAPFLVLFSLIFSTILQFSQYTLSLFYLFK